MCEERRKVGAIGCLVSTSEMLEGQMFERVREMITWSWFQRDDHGGIEEGRLSSAVGIRDMYI